MDLFPIDKEDDDILLNFINSHPELENSTNVTAPQTVPSISPTMDIQPQFMTNNIQNVQNILPTNPAFMPRMYFPGSTVTINYNFNTK